MIGYFNMGVFDNNITSILPKRVRAEQEAINCALKVVDRVNNNIGACRYAGMFDPFVILKNELICDNREHKHELKECFGVACGAYVRHEYNKSKDPEKWSGDFEITYAYVDLDANSENPPIFRPSVWIPVELYLYPNWKK